MDELNEQLKELTDLATTVQREYDEARETNKEAERASHVLVEQILQIVGPALPAITTTIITSQRRWWPTSTTTDEEVERSDDRFLHITGDSGPVDRCPNANTGAYEGTGLFLREDGKFVEISWDGHWSRWQGATTSYTANIKVYDSSLEAFSDDWSHEAVTNAVVQKLRTALKESAGKRRMRVDRDKRHVERLTAIGALLKKVRGPLPGSMYPGDA